MRKIASHVRGHFVAYLALFFALGGTSIAAVNALPKNSVGSPQIKNGSIQKVDVSRKTIASLRGSQGPQGPQGAQGIQGSKGDRGDKGDAGAAGATNVHVRTADQAIAAMDSTTKAVSCQNGERAVGGGYGIFNIFVDSVHVGWSTPTPSTNGSIATGWSVYVYNPTPGTGGLLRVYVVCAAP